MSCAGEGEQKPRANELCLVEDWATFALGKIIEGKKKKTLREEALPSVLRFLPLLWTQGINK